VFQSLTSRLGLAAMFLVCAAAAVRGRWPERATAGVICLVWLLSEALEDTAPHRKTQPILFGLDCAVLLFFLALVITTSRRWVVWATAYNLLLVLTHIGAWIAPQVHRYAFFTAYFLWSYCVLAALAVGVWAEGHRPTSRPY
jgi:hypothetical protein